MRYLVRYHGIPPGAPKKDGRDNYIDGGKNGEAEVYIGEPLIYIEPLFKRVGVGVEIVCRVILYIGVHVECFGRSTEYECEGGEGDVQGNERGMVTAVFPICRCAQHGFAVPYDSYNDEELKHDSPVVEEITEKADCW